VSETETVYGREERAIRGSMKLSGMEKMLDFEMPVRISLAKASVPLREVLKLSTGSVLELNRSLDDLVDIVVNNRVIAQGEIVVVEGNYGVRIHHVNDQARDAASQAEVRS
jgi:flagellar motor switch protein FliN/FliY